MGLWAGGLGGWANGGRWGEVVILVSGESGFNVSMGLLWAMVTISYPGRVAREDIQGMSSS